nr:MFS transporter [Naumannella cuiyingiana]
MALAAAIGTGSAYPLQPAMADVADALNSTIGAIGVALAAAPVGYLIGLCLLVPLVDRFPPGRVLAAQFGGLAVALASAAAVGSTPVLGGLIGVVGAFSAVGAGISSVAGRLARSERRAVTLGVVTAGISAGILAGRIAGGWLSDAYGWRAMLLVFAAACAGSATGCLVLIPRVPAGANRDYLATVRSLPRLIVRNRLLRSAAIRGSAWFFAFCAIWAGLAAALAEPPYSYPAERIGRYALAGLAGMLITPLAGALTDRIGPRRVILCGLALAGAAAVGVALGLSSPVQTLACLALFDAGLFAAQVANQSTVLAIDPAAPARFNGAYMVVYFVGGSLGTAFGPLAVGLLGWTATALIAAAAIAFAAVLTTLDRRSVAGVGFEPT